MWPCSTKLQTSHPTMYYERVDGGDLLLLTAKDVTRLYKPGLGFDPEQEVLKHQEVILYRQ